MHVLGAWLETKAVGDLLFPEVTRDSALKALRLMLLAIGYDRPQTCGTHAFRRGHAEDMRRSGRAWCFVGPCARRSCAYVVAGAPLWHILAAGDWRSPAFMCYMDQHKLETELVLQAHDAESDSQGDD